MKTSFFSQLSGSPFWGNFPKKLGVSGMTRGRFTPAIVFWRSKRGATATNFFPMRKAKGELCDCPAQG
jgi:hypothetical protein